MLPLAPRLLRSALSAACFGRAGITSSLRVASTVRKMASKAAGGSSETSAAGGGAPALARMPVSLEAVEIYNPRQLNLILGHSHFIKTVEDLYEVLAQHTGSAKFGLAFNEASAGSEEMPGLKVRSDGNDGELVELAKHNALAIGAGHTFLIFLDDAFPVACLNAIKASPEVCTIHCATANPVQVILAATAPDRKGIVGVIDGTCPNAFESDQDKAKRHGFLRIIGYKR